PGALIDEVVTGEGYEADGWLPQFPYRIGSPLGTTGTLSAHVIVASDLAYVCTKSGDSGEEPPEWPQTPVNFDKVARSWSGSMDVKVGDWIRPTEGAFFGKVLYRVTELKVDFGEGFVPVSIARTNALEEEPTWKPLDGPATEEHWSIKDGPTTLIVYGETGGD